MVQDLGLQKQRSKVSLWTYQVPQEALGLHFFFRTRRLGLGHSLVVCRVTLVGGGIWLDWNYRLGMGVCFGRCLLGIPESASDSLNPHA